MRHFRRLYFDNPAVAGAFETFVSVIDKGRDSAGNPFYNIRVGNLTLPADVAQIDVYVLLTSCFFKLPIGATAIVDIYMPDLDSSRDPLSFDYQVFKAKPSAITHATQRSFMADAEKSRTSGGVHPLAEAYAAALASATKTSGSGEPKGPTAQTDPTGPSTPEDPTGPSTPVGSTSVGICTYPGGCHGQTSANCDPGEEPLFYTAVCGEDGQLTCELLEPESAKKRKR